MGVFVCYNDEMSLNPELSALIDSSAEVIQFAKDGKYEEAWIISLKDDFPSNDEINEYVSADDYEKLIVEFIWNNDVDEERYVLTVIQDDTCAEKDEYEFVKKCLDIFYEEKSFSDLIEKINQQIIGKEFLFEQPVQKIRLGVFNHWFSVGPIEMWDTGEVLDSKKIAQKIKSRPEVEKSKLNYQGLAFIYNFDGSKSGPYHILKTPCCYKQGDEWVVDIDLVNKNMRKMIEL